MEPPSLKKTALDSVTERPNRIKVLLANETKRKRFYFNMFDFGLKCRSIYCLITKCETCEMIDMIRNKHDYFINIHDDNLHDEYPLDADLIKGIMDDVRVINATDKQNLKDDSQFDEDDFEYDSESISEDLEITAEQPREEAPPKLQEENESTNQLQNEIFVQKHLHISNEIEEMNIFEKTIDGLFDFESFNKGGYLLPLNRQESCPCASLQVDESLPFVMDRRLVPYGRPKELKACRLHIEVPLPEVLAENLFRYAEFTKAKPYSDSLENKQLVKFEPRNARRQLLNLKYDDRFPANMRFEISDAWKGLIRELIESQPESSNVEEEPPFTLPVAGLKDLLEEEGEDNDPQMSVLYDELEETLLLLDDRFQSLYPYNPTVLERIDEVDEPPSSDDDDSGISHNSDTESCSSCPSLVPIVEIDKNVLEEVAAPGDLNGRDNVSVTSDTEEPNDLSSEDDANSNRMQVDTGSLNGTKIALNINEGVQSCSGSGNSISLRKKIDLPAFVSEEGHEFSLASLISEVKARMESIEEIGRDSNTGSETDAYQTFIKNTSYTEDTDSSSSFSNEDALPFSSFIGKFSAERKNTEEAPTLPPDSPNFSISSLIRALKDDRESFDEMGTLPIPNRNRQLTEDDINQIASTSARRPFSTFVDLIEDDAENPAELQILPSPSRESSPEGTSESQPMGGFISLTKSFIRDVFNYFK